MQYSLRYTLSTYVRAFNEQTPLIFKWVEHKCLMWLLTPPKIAPTPTSSEDSREISVVCIQTITTSKLLCSTYLKIKAICSLEALKFKYLWYTGGEHFIKCNEAKRHDLILQRFDPRDYNRAVLMMGDSGGGVCIMEFTRASSHLFGLHLGIHDNNRIPFPELLCHKHDGVKVTYIPKVSHQVNSSGQACTTI